MSQSIEDEKSHEARASSWIRRLKQEGGQKAGRFVFIRYRKAEIRSARFAFIVSRKIGKAVVRNKMKRRLREISSKNLKAALMPGYYLLIARSSIVEADFEHLQEDILGLVRTLFRDKK